MTTLSTAAEALRGEEIDRTRAFIRIGWIVAGAVSCAALLIPGDPRLRIALLVAIAATVLASVWVYYRLADRAPTRVRLTHALAFAAVICGELGILYAGTFSSATLLVTLGLYFFCRTENRAMAMAVYLLAVGTHGIEATLVITGAIADPGFAPVRTELPLLAQIAGQVTIQQVYWMSFWLARQTRKSSLRTIEQLQRATRTAAQRDVQLAELREDLDRALKIGGPGRFTGHVVGAWTLGNVLGRGAMGEIYEAKHVRSGSEAAVKMLRRNLLADRSHVERFYREVRIATAIDSPHVVRVLEASSAEDPIPFLAMELLRGHTLGEVVRSKELDRPRLSVMIEQIAAALEHAREAGIVHRDLKPNNIFFTDDGTWKVLDFGVAALADSSGTLTGRGIVGTPAYMAPEQARGEPVDHRADVYALGAVIYRCLTGHVPFVARDTNSVLYAVVHQMPLRPCAIARVTAHDEACLAIALAKDKQERFQTVGELAQAFAIGARGDIDETLLHRARAILKPLPWTLPEESRR